MDELVAVLPENGDGVTFDSFKSDARAAGANVTLWLRAKHANLLRTYFADGQLMIARVVEQ